MPAFAVLLRGVNVGKGNRVPMADFRTLLEDLGYTNVSTLLNSGNAVFTARSGTPASHAARIADQLESRLHVRVSVIVKTDREMVAIVAGNPFPVDEESFSRFLVIFTQQVKELAPLSIVGPLVSPPEQFAIGPQAAYLTCPNGIAESKAALALLGKAGPAATTRNLATTMKLLALLNR